MRKPLILLTFLICLIVAAPAGASSSGEVGIADDGIMLSGTDAEVSNATSTWKGMGVDTVRVFARWVATAPGGESARTKPAGFDATDPNDPQYRWGALDRAIGSIRGAGMKVMLNITGSGPCWASTKPSKCNKGRFYPSPKAYADYAEAIAKRYGPQVDTYILFNEPNQVLWLQPQAKCKNRKCVPESPHVYRDLVRAATPRIRAADATSTILIGALSPRGKSLVPRTSKPYYNVAVHPLDFIRALGCVDKRYKRIRTGACKGFKPVEADGFAYHPHGIKLAPDRKSPNSADAQMADLSRLTSVLDKVTSKGGMKVRGARRFNLYLDEYAYQTNPPDKIAGVSLVDQARYLQQGAFIAWRNSRVMNLTQYVYEDDNGSESGWQSGLLTTTGQKKPAFDVFPIPFWAQKVAKGKVQLWGQVRPGSGVHSVQLQRRSGSSWVTIATVNTNASGYYTSTIAHAAATQYRALTSSGGTASRFITK